MNTHEIEEMMKRNDTTRKYFIGVFAVDQLPKFRIEQEVWLLVCNCCPMNMPGEHWIALYCNARREVEMFDSFGFSPNVYDGVHQFIHAQEPTLISFNTHHLQSITSTACGPYCLFYAYYRARGLSMATIVENILEELNRDNFIIMLVCIMFS